MRTPDNLFFLLGDHLGSTSLTTDANGVVASEARYKTWGETRYSAGTVPTNYAYTGQYSYASDFGLLFYNARWYDPYLNHFTQPDSIVPDPFNSQAWDRYAYALNNPLKYTDPTGHDVDCGIGDSYCNDARREYHYSWRATHNTSFQTFMRARDAYGFYYNHPDIALEDQYLGNDQEVSSWEDVDPYTLGSVYSEDVRHEMFTPVSDQFLVWEMDRLNALRDAGESVDPKQWAALAAALFITFGPDGGSGGGGGGQIWKGDFPSTSSSPSLYRVDASGNMTHFATYDEAGNAIMRVDLVGDAHGGVPTPHYHPALWNVNPDTGKIHFNGWGDAFPWEP